MGHVDIKKQKEKEKKEEEQKALKDLGLRPVLISVICICDSKLSHLHIPLTSAHHE
jgi:hypothetical protein